MTKEEIMEEFWNKIQGYIYKDDFSVDGRLIVDVEDVQNVMREVVRCVNSGCKTY